MKRTSEDLLCDHEIIDLLADDPELFALADAIRSTARQTVPAALTLQTASKRRSWPVRRLSAGVAVAAGLALALISPWSGPHGGLVQRALGAIGDGRVLHAVLETTGTYGKTIDISSGTEVAQPVTTEIWFDSLSDQQAIRTSVRNVVVSQLLQTPTGGWSDGGPIITCAWIAAHPSLAARANVSCDTTSQQATPQVPTVNPAILGFVDRYRHALASGQAKEIGTGKLGGRDVVWLEILVPSSASSSAHEQVALDAQTFAPLLVQQSDGSAFRVTSIESEMFDAHVFEQPTMVDHVSGSSVTSRTPISYGDTRALLDGQAVALGTETPELSLRSSQDLRLSIGYGPFSSRAAFNTAGVEYEYAWKPATDRQGLITISESLACAPGWGWRCDATDPRSGEMLKRGPTIVTLVGKVYVTVWNWHGISADDIRSVIRSLRPIAQTP